MKFKKKPVVVEATQWWQNGDHPQDEALAIENGMHVVREGKIVRYFRHPDIPGKSACVSSLPCVFAMHDHGWIDTPEGGHTVCPGDWIITGIKGERYPCKPDIFQSTYEPL